MACNRFAVGVVWFVLCKISVQMIYSFNAGIFSVNTEGIWDGKVNEKNLSGCNGQLSDNGGVIIRDAFYVHGAVIVFDQTAADGQPKTGPHSFRLC